MVGYNRQAVFKEIEPLLSEEERAEIAERERQEREGNIPRHDCLTELYQEYERENREHMQILTELIGIDVALMEGASPEMQGIIRGLIAEDMSTIETLRKDILNDRKTVAELKRLQR
jgi:hypothetical protein